MSKMRRWLLVMFIGLCTLMSYWVLEMVRSKNDSGTKTISDRPDYFIENFDFIKILPDGQNKYRIVGTKLVHYPNDNHADVTSPVLTSMDPTRPVTVRAHRGTIKNIGNKTKNEVHLFEKVVLTRAKTDTAEPLQLDTEYMMAYPDQNRMETDLPVAILSGDIITTGTGMKANNATEQIHILKNVYSILPSQKIRTKR
jgi:lipopolysaccharide export system protein LptC